MKKLFSMILVFGLLFCNVSYAKIITLEKCYENNVKTEILRSGHDRRVEEWGPNDKSWSEKSYKEYMTASDYVDPLADPTIATSKDENATLDEMKVAINTETLILSIITFSSPEVLKSNWKIIDYTEGIVFTEDLEWDDTVLDITSIGSSRWQVNLNDSTMLLRSNNFNENTTLNNSRSEFRTTILICQASEQSDGDIAGGASSGTAFFVSKKGHLLTNNHVVAGCKLSKISYFNKEYEAKLIATDKTLDLALLKVKVRPKSYFEFSKDEPKKLQKIYVAGYPLGKGLSDDLKITTGIISSLKGFEDNSNEIQVDAAINPGNSGGPIVNEKGQLVAIAVAGMSKDITEGINFGIKASAAANFLKSNKVSPSKSLMSFSTSSDELLEILEKGTVYTFCN